MNMPRDEITASEITALQSLTINSLNGMLTDRAWVMRKTITQDAYGTHTETWTNIGLAACIIWKNKNASEKVEAGEIKATQNWEGQFAFNMDVRPQDRVERNTCYNLSLGAPTGGTFTLSFDGETTEALPYDATEEDIQTAMRALVSFGHIYHMNVYGRGPHKNFVVQLLGSLMQTTSEITGDGSSLVGGSFRLERQTFEVLAIGTGETNQSLVLATLRSITF